MSKISDLLEQNAAYPSNEMVDNFYKRTKYHQDLVANNIIKIIQSGKLDSQLNPELEDRARIHDNSKYSDDEMIPYVWGTEMYRCKNNGIPFEYPEGIEQEFAQASYHHVTNNRHHPEYHSLNKSDLMINPADRGKSLDVVEAYNMSDIDLIEMVADWTAMSQELNQNGGSAKSWADKNINKRWLFEDYQVDFIYKIINMLDELNAENQDR
jgi:hypothetical protein